MLNNNNKHITMISKRLYCNQIEDMPVKPNVSCMSCREIRAKLKTDILLFKNKAVHSFKNLSKRNKNIMLGYACCAFLSFAVSSFVDGKKAIRENRKKHGSYYSHDSEKDLKAAKQGCYQNFGTNIAKSLIFPLYWVTNFLPYMAYMFTFH